MANFYSSEMLSSDGTVFSFSPNTATIDGFSFAIPESFEVYNYDVLKIDENSNLLVGSASSIDGDGSGIFYTSFDNNGFSSEVIEVLNDNRYSNQTEPIIAKSDSEIIVTWWDANLSKSVGHFFDLSLNDVGKQINFQGFDYWYSELVSAGDGNFVVFDRPSSGEPSRIIFTEISSSGVISPASRVGFEGNPTLASVGATTTTTGKIWLVTSHHAPPNLGGGEEEILLAEFSNGALNEPITANFNLTYLQKSPQVLETGDEKLLVTWSEQYGYGSGYAANNKMYGRFFSLEGTPLSLDILIANDVINPDGYSISVRENGGFSVYYTDTANFLKVKSFDSSGTVVQDATVLAENVTRYDNTTVLTLSDTQDEVFYNIDYQVYSQKINYNTVPIGDLVLSGEAIEDAILTLSTSLSDSDDLGDFSYQWLRGDEAINNAAGTSYQIGSADIGSLLKVQVQYIDGGGVTETVISDPTTAIQNVNDAPVGDLSISGQPVEGIELTAVSNISDEDGIGELSFIWYRDDLLISNANASKFLLTQADVGKSIKLQAQYTDGFGTLETVTSLATDFVVNTNNEPQGTVSILGTTTEGNTLTVAVDISDTDGLGSFAYQWLRDDSVILGQTAQSYALTQTDVGTQISFAVNYVDGFDYAETVVSSSTDPIANLNAPAEGTVQISGIAAQGSVLTAIPAISDADGLGEFQYQWLRNDLEISGAEQVNYVLTQADVGASISAKVTFEDGYGFSESINSVGSAVVTNTNDAPQFSSVAQTNFTVGQTYYYQALVSDPDTGDELTLMATAKPEWLTLNSETGELFGLPTASDVLASNVTLRVTDSFGEHDEQSFSLVSNLSSGGFAVINLDDPLLRTEYAGTSAADIAQGDSNTSFFGFGGDDEFNSGNGPFSQYFVGLEGDDLYKINAQGTMVVADVALSDGDKISATGIDFSSPYMVALTVENRHLLLGDAHSLQEIWIVDWETSENRIETFELSGIQYSYADFNSIVKNSNKFLGDYQWTDIAELIGDSAWNKIVFDNQIAYYKKFVANSDPKITSTSTAVIAENQYFEYQIVISDHDSDAITSGQPYLIPDWLNFDSTTLKLYGTPSESDIGTHNVILSAHDEFNSLTSHSFVLTVLDTTAPAVVPVTIIVGHTDSENPRTRLADQQLIFKSEVNTTASLTIGSLETLSQDLSFTHVEFSDSSYDHGISISDVVLQLRDIVGLSSLEGKQKIAADIDRNNEVTISDVVSNLRHIVGLDTIEECALVDSSDNRVESLTSSTIADLTLVQYGDVDLSATFLIA